MTIKAKDFDHIMDKLGFETRDSGDRLAWLKHEGKTIIKTRRSHIKGRDLPFQHQIRQQLYLNEDEFLVAASCHLSREDYLNILKQKRIL